MTKEELKQEAKEYADKYGKSNFDIWDTARFAYYQSAEPREKRITELEKEIAELRKDKKELCHSISEGGKACVYLNEQLTKAKEIIRDLLNLPFANNEEVFADVLSHLDEAEQFLKELE